MHGSGPRPSPPGTDSHRVDLAAFNTPLSCTFALCAAHPRPLALTHNHPQNVTPNRLAITPEGGYATFGAAAAKGQLVASWEPNTSHITFFAPSLSSSACISFIHAGGPQT